MKGQLVLRSVCRLGGNLLEGSWCFISVVTNYIRAETVERKKKRVSGEVDVYREDVFPKM